MTQQNIFLPQGDFYEKLVDLFAVAAIVFLLSTFGIFTRPIDMLALFWPANAVLLGLMVRRPRAVTIFGWIGALLGYVVADLIFGGTIVRTLWLTAANMAGVFAGTVLYRFAGSNHIRLREPQSVILMFLICSVSAMASAFVGGFAGGFALGQDYFNGFEFWISTELVNYIIVLPIMLIAPAPSEWRKVFASAPSKISSQEIGFLPIVALALSMLVSKFIDGFGGFAFSIPALLWCAVSFSLLPTAILTLAFSIWALTVLTYAGAPETVDPLHWMQSVRLGLGMIAMAPLSVASAMSVRESLLKRLQDSVDHDSLTRALTRGTFMARGEDAIARAQDLAASAVLMLDVDHFKSVNDIHGHAVGDLALVEFASAVSGSLRKDDLFGRTGGEEFCIVFPGSSLTSAKTVAERIRKAVERVEISLPDGQKLKLTVSGGLSVHDGASAVSFADLIKRADEALYKAKAEGRNRIAFDDSKP